MPGKKTTAAASTGSLLGDGTSSFANYSTDKSVDKPKPRSAAGGKAGSAPVSSNIFAPPEPVKAPPPREGAMKLNSDIFAADRPTEKEPVKKKIVTPRKKTPERRAIKPVEKSAEQKAAEDKREKAAASGIMIGNGFAKGGKSGQGMKNKSSFFGTDEARERSPAELKAEGPTPVGMPTKPISNIFGAFADPNAPNSPPASAEMEGASGGKKIAKREGSLEGVFAPVADNKTRKPVAAKPFGADDSAELSKHKGKATITPPAAKAEPAEIAAPKKKLLGPPPAASPIAGGERDEIKRAPKKLLGPASTGSPFATNKDRAPEPKAVNAKPLVSPWASN